jgi:hypothetical protein
VADLKEWLALAPKPPELSAANRWHVFLSYRSVERSWVLSLYDTLTQLGYRTFMDQFVLDAASGLAGSLQQNLAASQSGVLVWSPRSEDSDWCQREYDAFVTMEGTGKSFRYVVARVGQTELPLFARTKLWLDFSDDREGPRGTGLLKLLYGLDGKPLPAPAVQLAADIDDQTRKDLARIRARANDKDVGAVLELAQSEHLAWRVSPLLKCAAAEALIAIGGAKDALQVLEPLLEQFPKSVRPQQLCGLAYARSGNWRKAKQLLADLYELGERDAETVGIYARTWMDSYESSGDELHLRKSRALYAEAFETTPSDYYVGINAAAKSVFLRELSTAADYATKVEKLVGAQKRPGNYWMTATVAEVQLIQRNFDKSAELYSDAIMIAPGQEDNHRSTWKQAKRLLQYLDPTPEQMAKMEKAFAHLHPRPN